LGSLFTMKKYDKILVGGHLGAGIGFMLGGLWVMKSTADDTVAVIGAGGAVIGFIIVVMSLKKVIGLFRK